MAPSAIRRWHAPADTLPERKRYRPKTLAKVAAQLKSSPAGTPVAAGSIVHTVVPGDTLRQLARKYLGDANRRRYSWRIPASSTTPRSSSSAGF